VVPPAADLAPESIAAAFLAIVEIHGFGNWSAGWSSGDPYGHARGRVPNLFDIEAAPFFVARPVEPLTIYIQPFFAVSAEEELSASLDFAFAEWRFSDEIALRVGQVSQPFGLYNEILDIGVLQPFTLLPQSVYGPTGMVVEGYPGVGLTGSAAPGDIELRWDVYGGSLATESEDPANEHIKAILGGDVDDDEAIDAMVGGRLIVTVADGLELGGSAWGGYIVEEEELTGAMSLHAEWQRESFKLRAELASRAVRYSELELNNVGYGGYVEGTLLGGNGPQLVGRLDAYTNTFFGAAAIIPEAERLAPASSHVESAVGVNWQFAPNLVVKSAYHLVFGHRFAQAEDLVASLAEDARPDPFTHVVQLGAAFSF
jgi:hypothetical protein